MDGFAFDEACIQNVASGLKTAGRLLRCCNPRKLHDLSTLELQPGRGTISHCKGFKFLSAVLLRNGVRRRMETMHVCNSVHLLSLCCVGRVLQSWLSRRVDVVSEWNKDRKAVRRRLPRALTCVLDLEFNQLTASTEQKQRTKLALALTYSVSCQSSGLSLYVNPTFRLTCLCHFSLAVCVCVLLAWCRPLSADYTARRR